jgi:hypothetical protein
MKPWIPNSFQFYLSSPNRLSDRKSELDSRRYAGRSWDKSLPYAEFSYNNSYQEGLKMVPFKMLYG